MRTRDKARNSFSLAGDDPSIVARPSYKSGRDARIAEGIAARVASRHVAALN
jgi:hypothetical protein